MKRNLQILLPGTFALIIFCALSSIAQQMPNPPITGGYGSASVVDKQIVAAANYAVKSEAGKTGSKIKLISIKCAEQQVVAGMNYRVYLRVETTKRGKKASQTVEAVVYKNLKQKYSLTSWMKGNCPTP